MSPHPKSPLELVRERLGATIDETTHDAAVRLLAALATERARADAAESALAEAWTVLRDGSERCLMLWSRGLHRVPFGSRAARQTSAGLCRHGLASAAKTADHLTLAICAVADEADAAGPGPHEGHERARGVQRAITKADTTRSSAKPAPRRWKRRPRTGASSATGSATAPPESAGPEACPV